MHSAVMGTLSFVAAGIPGEEAHFETVCVPPLRRCMQDRTGYPALAVHILVILKTDCRTADPAPPE